MVVALVAVHAARATAIRMLALDDIDLTARRVRIDGHVEPLSELVHRAVVAWLEHRQRTWPRTPNRHLLISEASATGTGPVSDFFLSFHLLLRGVHLEHIRGDRVVQEALAVGADPLHLAEAFRLSAWTAVTYAHIARSLLERPIEAVAPSGNLAHEDSPAH